MAQAMSAPRATSARHPATLGEAPPALPIASVEHDAVEAAMHALLVSARPQSSSEALWILRQHYPQVSLTNRVAAISAVLRF
jgi:hypothetical protein